MMYIVKGLLPDQEHVQVHKADGEEAVIEAVRSLQSVGCERIAINPWDEMESQAV